jgi:hypothetical protein
VIVEMAGFSMLVDMLGGHEGGGTGEIGALLIGLSAFGSEVFNLILRRILDLVAFAELGVSSVSIWTAGVLEPVGAPSTRKFFKAVWSEEDWHFLFLVEILLVWN